MAGEDADHHRRDLRDAIDARRRAGVDAVTCR